MSIDRKPEKERQLFERVSTILDKNQTDVDDSDGAESLSFGDISLDRNPSSGLVIIGFGDAAESGIDNETLDRQVLSITPGGEPLGSVTTETGLQQIGPRSRFMPRFVGFMASTLEIELERNPQIIT